MAAAAAPAGPHLWFIDHAKPIGLGLLAVSSLAILTLTTVARAKEWAWADAPSFLPIINNYQLLQAVGGVVLCGTMLYCAWWKRPEIDARVDAYIWAQRPWDVRSVCVAHTAITLFGVGAIALGACAIRYTLPRWLVSDNLMWTKVTLITLGSLIFLAGVAFHSIRSVVAQQALIPDQGPDPDDAPAPAVEDPLFEANPASEEDRDAQMQQIAVRAALDEAVNQFHRLVVRRWGWADWRGTYRNALRQLEPLLSEPQHAGRRARYAEYVATLYGTYATPETYTTRHTGDLAYLVADLTAIDRTVTEARSVGLLACRRIWMDIEADIASRDVKTPGERFDLILNVVNQATLGCPQGVIRNTIRQLASQTIIRLWIRCEAEDDARIARQLAVWNPGHLDFQRMRNLWERAPMPRADDDLAWPNSQSRLRSTQCAAALLQATEGDVQRQLARDVIDHLLTPWFNARVDAREALVQSQLIQLLRDTGVQIPAQIAAMAEAPAAQ